MHAPVALLPSSATRTDHGRHDRNSVTSQQLDERELRAWRGMLRATPRSPRRSTPSSRPAHGLPLSSYEVLMYLADAEGRRMRMRDLADVGHPQPLAG